MATGTNTVQKQPLAKLLAGRLDCKKIGSFALVVAETRPIRPRHGWFHVAVGIRDRSAGASAGPLMTAIVSGGGRGVKPWFECRLFPSVIMKTGHPIDARALGLEAGMVNLVASLLPPGGHLMIDYESEGQEETFAELILRVPPPATYLGCLMFRAGCRGEFKDWYFSEGGHEGPRKLQANKSPDARAARCAMDAHRRELSAFIARRLPTDKTQAAIVARAQSRARALLADCL